MKAATFLQLPVQIFQECWKISQNKCFISISPVRIQSWGSCLAMRKHRGALGAVSGPGAVLWRLQNVSGSRLAFT